MAEYLVRVADDRGHVSEQVESAHNEAEVRDRFAQQGLLVYSVRPRGLMLLRGGKRPRKIKLEPFVIFNEQFVTLVHAGLPIIQSLDLLVRRQRDERFRAMLEDVRDRVRNGAL